MKLLIPFLSLLLIITSCQTPDPNTQIDEGKIEKNLYTSDELGWSMQIPNGWINTTREQIMKARESAGKTLADNSDVQIDHNSSKILVGFGKGKLNLFQSNSISGFGTKDTWRDNLMYTRELLLETFTQAGADTEMSEVYSQPINGIEFLRFDNVIKSHTGEIVFEQSIFGTFRNNLEFRVIINSDNEEDKKELFDAWYNSKFE